MFQAQADRRYGKDKHSLPEELAFREGPLDSRYGKPLRRRLLQAEAEGGVPDDKAQRNFTDPSPLHQGLPASVQLSGGGGQRSPDRGGAPPTRLRISNRLRRCGGDHQTVGASPGKYPPGYYSAKAVDEPLGVDPFVAPEQTRHGRVVPPAPRGRI